MLLSPVHRVLHGFERSYRQARYLASVARSRWFSDPRQIFDHISATGTWNYHSELERDRHRRVLARVCELRGNLAWGRALELGCYDGIFTQALAPSCSDVLACDISSDACARTLARCASFPQVRATQLNITTDELSGRYDVIFAMDILNYVYGRDRMLRVSSNLASVLEDNGMLVITDCRLASHIRDAWFRFWVPVGGDNIVRLFASQPHWRLLTSEFHPDSGEDADPDYMAHVIAIFEKAKKGYL